MTRPASWIVYWWFEIGAGSENEKSSPYGGLLKMESRCETLEASPGEEKRLGSFAEIVSWDMD